MKLFYSSAPNPYSTQCSQRTPDSSTLFQLAELGEAEALKEGPWRPPAPACELKESHAHTLASPNRASCSKGPKPHNDTVQCGQRGEEKFAKYTPPSSFSCSPPVRTVFKSYCGQINSALQSRQGSQKHRAISSKHAPSEQEAWGIAEF